VRKRMTKLAIVALIIWPPVIPDANAQMSDHWPAGVMNSKAFDQIGAAIAAEPNFPTHGSEMEKAHYVFSRLPEIQKKYDLKAGTGGPVSQPLVLGGRGLDRFDPEDVAALKVTGTGNCAEWSQAFQHVLGGAGVHSTVMYADDDPAPGRSWGFDKTDTALFVEEVVGGRKIRRVFDPFRAVYHAQHDGTTVEDQINKWVDLPMRDDDRLPRDVGDHWLSRCYPKKRYVKLATTMELIPPNDTERPGVPLTLDSVTKRLVGTWQNQENGATIGLYLEGGTLTARGITGSARSRVLGIPDNSYLFKSGKINLGKQITITSKGGYTYADKNDCKFLGPYPHCLVTARFLAQRNLLVVDVKKPKYDPDRCEWAAHREWGHASLNLKKIAE
jgi:hypothetical protein